MMYLFIALTIKRFPFKLSSKKTDAFLCAIKVNISSTYLEFLNNVHLFYKFITNVYWSNHMKIKDKPFSIKMFRLSNLDLQKFHHYSTHLLRLMFLFLATFNLIPYLKVSNQIITQYNQQQWLLISFLSDMVGHAKWCRFLYMDHGLKGYLLWSCIIAHIN